MISSEKCIELIKDIKSVRQNSRRSKSQKNKTPLGKVKNIKAHKERDTLPPKEKQQNRAAFSNEALGARNNGMMVLMSKVTKC